ncbi:ABC transporter substrate-binding protein [Colwellia sp. E2M01]|uniref:ABC transporter substrate-binding protein n=1 Tax=Colwellia sp. E2M01 TaxID=2841561 RepID=UPI001C08F88E|nr:ABC transporter substrate-binding protein [Colwellia sp. E2M01]MBU2872320.1 ABC transporter substrate-binding protein [Colwellia sp. E2M01]
MNFNFFSIFTLVTFTSLLSGCNDGDKLTLSERSIIYCSEGPPETFNPQLSISGTTTDATSKQLYNRLLVFKGKNNILAPSLAKSWHVTHDGKKITLYLRQDVSFHQTNYFTPKRLFNADDVLFSFNRILSKNNAYHNVSSGQYPFFESIKFNELVDKVEKINDHTVRFILKRNDSSFLANLATDYAVVLSAEYAQQLSANNNQHNIDILPIGTGPFKLKDYRVGSFIRFYRHDDYWQGKAHIEQLVYDISPSKTSRLTKFLAKECDVSSYPIAHKKITDRKDLTLESITSLNVGYLGFNTQKPPFNDKAVRQAVSLAINKQALIETVYQDQATRAKSILPETSWAYDNNITEISYDPKRAKALLASAGYSQGISIDLWAMPLQRAYNPNAITMAKLIQNDLKKINIKVNIISYEWTAFLRRLSQGEHQSFLLGWTADNPDPDNFFTPMLSCSATDKGSNHTFWCNKKYDQLLSSALHTSDINKRKSYYTKAMAIIKEEAPLLPIAHSKRFQARDINIEGDILEYFGGINFYQVSKRVSKKVDGKALNNTTMISSPKIIDKETMPIEKVNN